MQYFTLIATGGTGFRLVSNLLLSRSHYWGFVSFLEHEVQFVDLQPAKDIDQPHQMLAFRGHPLQTSLKQPISRHSEIVAASLILHQSFTTDDYYEITQGRPDPHEYISFLEAFFQFQPIADLSALGDFGSKIMEHTSLIPEVIISPYHFSYFRHRSKPMQLEEMHRMLAEKGIRSRIEMRGKKMAISFQNLPCPLCGKTTSNAYASPPSYNLFCYNTRCEANNIAPLSKWAGISLYESAENREDAISKRRSSLPIVSCSLSEIKSILKKELDARHDSLIIATPGAGKTYIALEWLTRHYEGKTILYSCLNKTLKEEVYHTFLSFPIPKDKVHLLHARDEVCTKKEELNRITSRGYSPKQLLCSSCPERDSCLYYNERKTITPGVYFVTHHMLRYVEKEFQQADLIILDENILDGFLLEYDCSDIDLLSLTSVLKNNEAQFIQKIVAIGQTAVSQYLKDARHPLLLQGTPARPSDIEQPSIIDSLAKTLLSNSE
ncbi:MAG: hypothetical protein ACP5I1_17925, partial [Candidatus Hinthialibacter sp.]